MVAVLSVTTSTTGPFVNFHRGIGGRPSVSLRKDRSLIANGPVIETADDHPHYRLVPSSIKQPLVPN